MVVRVSRNSRFGDVAGRDCAILSPSETICATPSVLSCRGHEEGPNEVGKGGTDGLTIRPTMSPPTGPAAEWLGCPKTSPHNHRSGLLL